MNEWRNPLLGFMKANSNGDILWKHLANSSYSQHLPQLPFASCNAVSLAQIRVCPKAVLTTLDFKEESYHLCSYTWLQAAEVWNRGKSHWEIYSMWNFPGSSVFRWIQGAVPVSPWLSRGIWKWSRAEVQSGFHCSSGSAVRLSVPDG